MSEAQRQICVCIMLAHSRGTYHKTSKTLKKLCSNGDNDKWHLVGFPAGKFRYYRIPYRKKVRALQVSEANAEKSFGS